MRLSKTSKKCPHPPAPAADKPAKPSVRQIASIATAFSGIAFAVAGMTSLVFDTINRSSSCSIKTVALHGAAAAAIAASGIITESSEYRFSRITTSLAVCSFAAYNIVPDSRVKIALAVIECMLTAALFLGHQRCVKIKQSIANAIRKRTK